MGYGFGRFELGWHLASWPPFAIKVNQQSHNSFVTDYALTLFGPTTDCRLKTEDNRNGLTSDLESM